MAKRSPQIAILKKQKSAYGGELSKTRAGRQRARPLATKQTMHLVLRSTLAKGDWSFRHAKNEKGVRRIVEKFAFVYGVRVLSMANVGNHLHPHIKLASRFGYAPFIRAITGQIAMLVTGRSRWSVECAGERKREFSSAGGTGASEPGVRESRARKKFWDYRPFTRVVESLRAVLNLRDYVRINELEGYGYLREHAKFIVEQRAYVRLE